MRVCDGQTKAVCFVCACLPAATAPPPLQTVVEERESAGKAIRARSVISAPSFASSSSRVGCSNVLLNDNVADGGGGGGGTVDGGGAHLSLCSSLFVCASSGGGGGSSARQP